MGQIDIPLNSEGISQARLAARYIEKHPVSHILSSPLKRAAETAQIIQDKIKTPIVMIEELKERHWGVIQGTTEHWDKIPGYWKTGYNPLGSEHIEEYLRRLKVAINIIKSHEYPLVIGHNGTYFGLCHLFHIHNFNRQPNGIPIRITSSQNQENKQNVILEPLV